MAVIEDIDSVKHKPVGAPKYRLRNANVHVSPGGFHFIDYFDPVEEIAPNTAENRLAHDERDYIEHQLQSNSERFAHQVRVVERFLDPTAKRILDIGCGGGLFLSHMRDLGAEVTGIEPSVTRANYAREVHGIEVAEQPVEACFWKPHSGSFDVITLWDVIEHVNEPGATLCAAIRLLKPGGLLMIDTPCRDAFYHRAGEWSYLMSGGRYPTFLNAMYSAHRFGHKQIFSTREMAQLLEHFGLSVLDLRKFHELSFPKEFYLRKLFRSEALVQLLTPFASATLAVFPIRNKMLIVGRKPLPDRH